MYLCVVNKGIQVPCTYVWLTRVYNISHLGEHEKKHYKIELYFYYFTQLCKKQDYFLLLRLLQNILGLKCVRGKNNLLF